MRKRAYTWKDPIERRLLERIEVTEDECWLFTGPITKEGYGHIKYLGSMCLAHRVSYLIFHNPIPDNKHLDHTCHRPDMCVGGNACLHRRCINPDHLEPVDNLENYTRGHGISRAVEASSNERRSRDRCPRDHEYTPENTRIGPTGKRYCRACVPIYNAIAAQRIRHRSNPALDCQIPHETN